MKRFVPLIFVAIASAAVVAASSAVPIASPGTAPALIANSRNIFDAPICFEENIGQANASARFIARNRDALVFIGTTEATLVFQKENSPSRTVRLSLVGANSNAHVSGLDEFQGQANYFLGSDPAQWHAAVPLFARVQLDEIYPGIQLIYYPSKSDQLEYDFVIRPGADPKQIALRISGADNVRVDRDGNLVLKIGRDEVRQHKPVVYQTVNGASKQIAGTWRLVSKNTAAFAIGDYDRALPLVIDPELSFSTYLGGTSAENAWDIATDSSGAVYICGDSLSANLLTTNFWSLPSGRKGKTYSGTQGSRRYGDAFVAKFTPTGISNSLQLAFLTYLGGSGQETANGAVADSSGVYVTGFTDSPNFPVTTNAAFRRIAGTNVTANQIFRSDAFVTKISSSGKNLLYSTYLGGSERDAGYAITVDDSGYAYVGGFTESTNFPAGTNLTSAIKDFVKAASHSNVYQKQRRGIQDAFVAKVDTDGSKIIYSTFLGGNDQESVTSIKVDGAGAAYVTGYTLSTNFPVVPKGNSKLNGIPGAQSVISFDAFVSKFSPDATKLEYSRYLGGANTDVALRLALNSSNDIFVAGYTFSTNFPITKVITNTRMWSNPLTNSPSDIFLTRLTQTFDGTNFSYSTNSPGYSVALGGGNTDEVTGLAVDEAGNVVLGGLTSSTNLFGKGVFDVFFAAKHFFATNFIANRKASTDKNYVFVAVLNPDASDFLFKAYLGGSENDVAHGIALSAPNEDLYISGNTASPNFPTQFPIQKHLNGTDDPRDAFVTAIPLSSILSSPASLRTRAAAIVPSPTLSITQSNGAVTITWPDTGINLVLESSATLSPGDWKPVAEETISNSGWKSLTLPATNVSSFFRLRAQ
jgi:hypothetical protein